MTEIRLPFHGKIIATEVVFDTEDVELVDGYFHRGFDSVDDGEGHCTRTLNGRNTLTLRISFKPFKHEMYEEAAQYVRGGSAMTGKEFREWAATVPAEDEEWLFREMALYIFTDAIDGMNEPKTAGEMRQDIADRYTAWKAVRR